MRFLPWGHDADASQEKPWPGSAGPPRQARWCGLQNALCRFPSGGQALRRRHRLVRLLAQNNKIAKHISRSFACGQERLSHSIFKMLSRLDQFQSETRRVSDHAACRFAEKRGFSARFGPGGAAPPPRVFTFFKAETLLRISPFFAAKCPSRPPP